MTRSLLRVTSSCAGTGERREGRGRDEIRGLVREEREDEEEEEEKDGVEDEGGEDTRYDN